VCSDDHVCRGDHVPGLRREPGRLAGVDVNDAGLLEHEHTTRLELLDEREQVFARMELGLTVEPHRPKGSKRQGRVGDLARGEPKRERRRDFPLDRFGIVLERRKRMSRRDL
jgi:hypothetical protein